MSGVSGNPELFGCCLFFLESFNLHSSTSATLEASTYVVDTFDVGVGVGVGVGMGVDMDVDMGVGDARGVGLCFLTITPLLHTSFFPDLMQVYFFPL